MPENSTDIEWYGESGDDCDGNTTPTSSKTPPIPSKVSKSKQINFYTTFKNKLFASSRYRESIMDLRKRAEREKALDDVTLLNAVKANYRFVYRINDGVGTTNTILQKVCTERGWREFHERQCGTTYEKAMKGATGWNLWWSYSIYQFSPYKYLRHWQFTNHNPKGFQFCNKVYLTTYIRKMKSIHGEVFDFYPASFIIPEDYLSLCMEQNTRSESFTLYNYNNMLVNPNLTEDIDVAALLKKRPKAIKKSASNSPASSTTQLDSEFRRFVPVWISKPVGQSQGKGIFLTTDVSTIATDKKSVVQEYISRPLLIAGYKWDIRIYVCVSAIDPLVIYIYQEGLCRFATEKYRTADLTAMYSHLTNASLNKLSPGYEVDKELIGPGCKWSLRKLRQYFKERNISDWLMWQKIMAMVVLTVIGDSLRLGYSASNRNCFDLFGFDVLVDEDLKPWLLECNYSPGLGGDCETDNLVKEPMLHDLFDLLGFPDKASYSETKKVNEIGIMTGEEVIKSEKLYAIDATRQYVDMLLHRIATADALEKRKEKVKCKPDYAYSAAARLSDAKNIYSQNLVVQYLRNQTSSNTKLSKQFKDQIISLAIKKLKKPASPTDKNGKFRPESPPSTSPQRSSSLEKIDRSWETQLEERPKTVGANNKKSLEIQYADPETFQKLKYYFDAGVDYPVDSKTGKFKECPALITVKKDWFNPPKQQGQWIRVYPFDARSAKSPYKSSLTDIRQAVRSIESYMKVAEHLFLMKPHESDDFYRKKVKSICRRETEIWTPPSVWGEPPAHTESDKMIDRSSIRQRLDHQYFPMANKMT